METQYQPNQIEKEAQTFWATNHSFQVTEDSKKEKFYCPVFNRMRNNIVVYAKNYEERFDQIAATKPSTCHD